MASASESAGKPQAAGGHGKKREGPKPPKK